MEQKPKITLFLSKSGGLERELRCCVLPKMTTVGFYRLKDEPLRWALSTHLRSLGSSSFARSASDSASADQLEAGLRPLLHDCSGHGLRWFALGGGRRRKKERFHYARSLVGG